MAHLILEMVWAWTAGGSQLVDEHRPRQYNRATPAFNEGDPTDLCSAMPSMHSPEKA